MGLFTQEISLKLSKSSYLIEKVTLPVIKKKKIELKVETGTIAIINGMTYKGQGKPHELYAETLDAQKGTELTAYLYSDKFYDSFPINFMGGKHTVKLSSAVSGYARGNFAVVGTIDVEIFDYKDLAAFFDCTITKEDVIEEINKNYRSHISNEINSAVSARITEDTTEVGLKGLLTTVVDDVLRSRQAVNVLMKMGLAMSKRGFTMHINPVDNAEEITKKLNDALVDKELEGFNKDKLDREELERQRQREHEINLIKAGNTKVEESTETKNINSNGNNPVTINEAGKGADNDKKFCGECGAQLKPGSKYCNFCGAKL